MTFSHERHISIGNFDPPRGGYSKENLVRYFQQQAEENLKESGRILKQIEELPSSEIAQDSTQEKVLRVSALNQATRIFQDLQVMMGATDLWKNIISDIGLALPPSVGSPIKTALFEILNGARNSSFELKHFLEIKITIGLSIKIFLFGLSLSIVLINLLPLPFLINLP